MDVNWPVLACDDVFYDDMPPLVQMAPITVRFLDPYSLSEVESKVVVRDVQNHSSVEGTWSACMSNTCFTFRPSSALSSGQRYEISVPESMTSISGRSPSGTQIRTFIVDTK